MNALFIHSVVPVTVTIRSGHDPSDMFILAPLCKKIIYLSEKTAEILKHCKT